MWIPTRKLHPAIGHEVNRLTRTIPLAHAERRRASVAWNRAWWTGHAREVFLGGSAMVAVVGLVDLAKGALPAPLDVLATPLAVATCAIAALPYFAHHSCGFTPRELAALLPGLELSPMQATTIVTLVALDEAGRPREEILEALGAMNGLLEEEARLLAARERIAGPLDAFPPLEAERAEYRAKADAAQETATREAYLQSLMLLDERVAGHQDLERRLERIDAHLALLGQAVFATRDAARRLASVPAELGEEFATDSLRAALALSRAQTQATESALAELRHA